MKRQPWTAGIELRAAQPPPPPPPGPPPHPHGGIPPHLIIIEGLQAVSAQVAELQAAVDEMRAAASVVPAR
ncbi:MAG: hypothetical protein HYY24_27545 [Verrucomicrobia bacterium]|nr:hypothetical protein [Verrucomicrobiota bacterium]